MKMLNIKTNSVQLIEDDEKLNEAFASFSKNPSVTWVRFVLTDDKPNANKDRIPTEEFANIIRTGLFMPLKMAVKQISRGHDGTSPLGAIAQLIEVEDRVEGIAALWNREREDDVTLIRSRYAEGKSIDISWEISFDDFEMEAEEVKRYRGVSLNAATVVGDPAYQGRTPVTAVAEKEDKTMETIEKERHDEIVKALDVEKSQLSTRVAELETEVKTLKEGYADYDELKKFKNASDEAQARLEKIEALKAKFTAAGLEVELADDNKVNSLLELSDNALNFYIQDLLVFASANKPGANASADRQSITSRFPNVSTGGADSVDLVEYLRNLEKPSGGK